MERNIENAIDLALKVISSIKIKEYSIPIIHILNNFGFAVYLTNMPSNILGFVLISPNLKENFGSDKIISVNRDFETSKQRFTLAYEFGCYLFNFDENDYKFTHTKLDDTNDDEVLVRFVTELLMPKEIFKNRFYELGNISNYDRLTKLTVDFKVPAQYVKSRIADLQLE